MINSFRFLKYALVIILAFVGVKLLLLSLPPYLDDMGNWVGLQIAERAAVKLDTSISLLVVVGLLVTAIVASVVVKKKG